MGVTRKQILVLVLLGAAPVARVAAAADEIHWTIGGQTVVTFEWRGPETTIAYGLTTAYGQTATATAPNPVPVSSAGPYREARLTGLLENTLYHYSVGGGPDHTFRTPPPRGTPDFSVFVEGDVGDGALFPRMATIQSMIAAANPRFVIVDGDLTYANDFGQAHVDRHFNDVMVWSQDAAYMPAWGNHEWDKTSDDLRNYKGRFDLPNAQASPTAPDSAQVSGPPPPYGKDWCWFDYGHTRFIAIPDPYTYGGGGPWADWYAKAGPIMDAAESDAAITFVVTFGHRPTYSSGFYAPGDLSLRAYLDALGAAHGKYVLDLAGHSHNYERSYRQSHVVHLTTGVGGANLEDSGNPACLWNGGCPAPAWSAFRAMRHATVQLRFTAAAIEGQVLCGPDVDSPGNRIDLACTVGSLIDTFTIQPVLLSTPGPAPRRLGIDRVAPNPAAGGVDLSYSLAGWEPATLEVLDPAGRLILRRNLAAGPGTHSIALGREDFPRPGLYFARLRQGRASAAAKVSITARGR